MIENYADLTVLRGEGIEIMKVLVNGTPKEISPIFDNTGCDITEKFLKEAATEGKVRDFSSEFFKDTNKDLDIYVVNRNLPILPTTDHPYLVNTVGNITAITLNEEKTVNMAHCIKYKDEKKQIEMTAVAVKWWEQYTQKYNEVSALENRIFPHMQNTVNKNIDFFKNLEEKSGEPFLYYYERSDVLEGRENPIFKYTQIAYDEKMGDFRPEYEIGDLHIAANEKGDWLRKYAETHKIDISDINQVTRLDWQMLSNMEPKEKDEQIVETIVENPKETTTEQAYMQLKADNTKLKNIFNLEKNIGNVNLEQQDIKQFIDKLYEYTTMVGMDYTKEFLKEQIGKDLSGEHLGRYNGFFIYEHLSSLCTSAILFKKDPQITMSAKNLLSEAESLISKYMDKDAVKTYKEIEALYINDMDDKHKETYASAKDVKIDYFYFTKEKAEQKIKDYESIFLTNIKLKYAVNKLREVINRTNAIFKENPSLSKAFEQAKVKFMQKHNSEKQEHPIDKPIQKNKPNKHSKK